MSPQSDKTVVEQVCINRKCCRRLIGAITYPVHGPPSGEPRQPTGKVTRSSNQQKPPEFVPASLWHRATQLPRRYTAIRRLHNKSNCSARATCRETSSLCQQSQLQLSQHRLPLHTEKPASSRCKEKTCPGEGCSGHLPQEINKSRS